MFRNDPLSFSTDKMALALTKECLNTKLYSTFDNNLYKLFMLMPLMHSENLEDQ